jgi:DNA polymerase-3 subunit delta
MQGSEITQHPKPVYLLASGEVLLTRDWLDDARRALRDGGFEDVLTLQADSGFDWQGLLDEGDMMSLFSSSKCRVVILPNGKPGQQGSKVIQQLCEDPVEGNVYIFVTPPLDRQQRNASWCKAIHANGEIVEIKPVYDNQLPDWLMQRARGKGIGIDVQAAQFLAQCTEGNLLAADQELEKLAVRFAGQDFIDFETIQDSVAQSARYSHFLLVDACLGGNARRALRILKSLQAEGYASVQLRWALQNALQQLDKLSTARPHGERIWQELRIWRSKQRLYQQALARLAGAQIERLLQSCATLDRLGKGQQDSEFPDREWFEIRSLVAEFSGVNGI